MKSVFAENKFSSSDFFSCLDCFQPTQNLYVDRIGNLKHCFPNNSMKTYRPAVSLGLNRAHDPGTLARRSADWATRSSPNTRLSTTIAIAWTDKKRPETVPTTAPPAPDPPHLFTGATWKWDYCMPLVLKLAVLARDFWTMKAQLTLKLAVCGI